MARPLALSIADAVVPWRERDWPIDWERIFGRRAPLVLEIGFGNGAFLEREARAHPERDHVGIELSWTSATHLLRRIDQRGLANVRLLLGDAQALLRQLIAPAALAEVFVNHPCPWPKERHAERRLVGPAFLALLAERMRAGAPLWIVTDHAAYARAIAETLEAQRDFVPALGATEVSELPGREPTKYERKAMAAGEPIHYFAWRRTDAAIPVAEPAPARAPMPSLTLQGTAGHGELFHGFQPLVETTTHAGVETTVKLAHAYRRLDEPAWLVQALVKEDRLEQEFALEVIPRAGGQLMIKLSTLGHPHPTFGVRRAVWRVAAWLFERHPELVPVRHNLADAAEEG
jgi:tRNA (guanine-N7-)-methyltransferase